MNRVLLAVDDTEGSRSVLSVLNTMVQKPESVILVHVQPQEEKPAMIDIPGGPGSTAVQGSTRGTDNEEKPGLKAEKIMGFYQKEIENSGPVRVKALVRDGIPSTEILNIAREEQVDLIVMGRSNTSGRVTKEVERNSPVPVLVAKTNGSQKNLAYGWREAYAA